FMLISLLYRLIVISPQTFVRGDARGGGPGDRRNERRRHPARGAIEHIFHSRAHVRTTVWPFFWIVFLAFRNGLINFFEWNVGNVKGRRTAVFRFAVN